MDYLTGGEKVFKKLSPSRRSSSVIILFMLGFLFIVIGISMIFKMLGIPEIFILSYDIPYYTGLLLLIISPFMFLYGEFHRRRLGTYIITNYRVIVKTGFLRTQIDSVTNKMIVNVRANQGIWQKMLGIGNVDISTTKGGEKELELVGISGYKDVENLIYKLMESRGGMGSFSQDQPAQEAPPQQPAPQQQQQPPQQVPPPTPPQEQGK
jgi:membrane protein YdbS with pleckstrin-like domain